MKKIVCAVLAAAVFVFAGCDTGSSTDKSDVPNTFVPDDGQKPGSTDDTGGSSGDSDEKSDESDIPNISVPGDEQKPDGSDEAGDGSGDSDEKGDESDIPSEPQTCPSEPQNVTAYANGFSSIYVSWDVVDGATSYVVYYRLALEDGEENGQETGNELTHHVYNISFGTSITVSFEDKKYVFWVKAENSIGESGRSNVVYAKSYFPAPSHIGGYTTGTFSTGTGCVHLSWTSLRNVSGYEIYAREKKKGEFGSSKKVFLMSVRSNDAVITGLKSGVYYFFSVRAVSGTEKSGYSPEYMI